jgi:hypothetical protein
MFQCDARVLSLSIHTKILAAFVGDDLEHAMSRYWCSLMGRQGYTGWYTSRSLKTWERYETERV